MTRRTWLATGLLAAAALTAGGLAWWFGSQAADGPETRARIERIEALQREIERELEALEAARRQHSSTEAELRALRDSLEQRLERIERLQRSLERTQPRDGA